MTDRDQSTVDPVPADLSAQLERAINHLSLGIVIFDSKREVVFCNRRYMEMYGLSPEQVKPGTPTSDLIRHRLELGLKVRLAPDEYIRERVGRDIALDTTVQEFTDGRIIAYTVRPMPDGGGIATHEDVTEREALHARIKRQYELVREQEENLRIRNFQFDTAINNMSQGLCFFNADHKLIVCNDRFVEMYGLPPGRVGPGTALTEIVDLRYEAGSFPAMSREEYVRWRTEIGVSNEAKDSIVELMNGRTIKIRHRPMPDQGWVATHEDITEQRQAEVKIEHMAHHDSLTDLANRAMLVRQLEAAREPVEAAARPSRCSSSTSTTSRRSTTRWAIPAATPISRSWRNVCAIRAEPTLSRGLGGDEFAVMARETGREEATDLGELIVDALRPY